MALNNNDLFLVNQGGESKKITYQNLKNNITSDRIDQGPLAGFRNVIINGNLAINQRGATYAAVAVGEYWADRWKKTASGMTQIVEEGNYIPSTQYTLSGTDVTTQQVISPASGNWTIPDVPSTATNIQLEPGPIATPFEMRHISIELVLCQRYYYASQFSIQQSIPNGGYMGQWISHPVVMRTAPSVTISTPTVFPTNLTLPSVSFIEDRGFRMFTNNPTGADILNAVIGNAFTANAEL